MGEELYRYQRRPYIDRHWNHREQKRSGPKGMGPEINRGEKGDLKYKFKNFFLKDRDAPRNKIGTENPGAALRGRALEQQEILSQKRKLN